MWVGGGRLHEAEGQAWRCPSTWAPLQGVLCCAAQAGQAEASLAWLRGRLPSCLPPMLLPNKPESSSLSVCTPNHQWAQGHVGDSVICTYLLSSCYFLFLPSFLLDQMCPFLLR